LPLGFGFLVGLAVVSVAFESVHGITLAFGFTLMGIAIDYPLHLFSHAKSAPADESVARIWPTLRLGALSTAVAYLAMAFSASNGLAQLGVFTAIGVLVAVTVTRFWLPCLLPPGNEMPVPRHNGSTQTSLRFLPVLLVMSIGSMFAVVFIDNSLWNDDLASLSPVPQQRLLADQELRSGVGSADMRYQIVLADPSLDELMVRSEKLDDVLAIAANDKVLESWQSISNLLSSEARLNARMQAIPDIGELSAIVGDVVSATPFRPSAFDPFVQAAADLATKPPLTIERFDDSPLRSWLDSHLLKVGETWVSLISLRNPNVSELTLVLEESGQGAELVDLKQSSIELIQAYRKNALAAIGFAALFIVGILWYQRRNVREVAWIVLTVAAALLLVTLSIVLFHGQMTVIHIIALLLVMGLGLDYALFLTRQESAAERQRSDHAVLACAISTTLAFGILAASSIPLLKFLGLTVATGSAASYLLAVVGSRFGQDAVS
jgi:predicted exporter